MVSEEPGSLSPNPVGFSTGDRLNSWKEIAAYLKYSERTVRRWEKEGLPVHRHPHKKKAAIYGYKAEIDSWWRDERTGPRPKTLDRRIMLAVLPLENLSGDPGQEYFNDGLTEEMITQLGRLHPDRLGVMARTSAVQYKGTKKSIPEIGRELSVDYILEGSVRREAGQVRISAQLIRVSDQTHLWAENYQRDMRNILLLQSDVASAIANQIALKLTPEQHARLVRPLGVSPEAYEAYLRGLHHLRKLTHEDTEKAFAYFQQAVGEDPNFALAYIGLAHTHLSLSTFYLAPSEVMPKAKTAVLKALELDETLAEAHAALGMIMLFHDWDWAGAEKQFNRAIELNPSLSEAYLGRAAYLAAFGRYDEALLANQRAQALDPLPVGARGDALFLAYVSGRYDETIKQCRKAIELEPKHFLAYSMMGLAHSQLGRHAEAIAAGEEARNFSDSPVALAMLGTVYARAGNNQQARKLLRELIDESERRYVCGFNVATIFATLGETDQAFEWLEKAYLQRSD